jgi:hypothetical protein
MVNQNPKQNFEQATQPNGISRSTSPTPANADTSADTVAVPSQQASRFLLNPSVNRRGVSTLVTKTIQENSVGVHTHLSPVLISQSPVDAQRGKGEGKEGQWPNFAAMRQNDGDCLSGRLIIPPSQQAHNLGLTPTRRSFSLSLASSGTVLTIVPQQGANRSLPP